MAHSVEQIEEGQVAFVRVGDHDGIVLRNLLAEGTEITRLGRLPRSSGYRHSCRFRSIIFGRNDDFISSKDTPLK